MLRKRRACGDERDDDAFVCHADPAAVSRIAGVKVDAVDADVVDRVLRRDEIREPPHVAVPLATLTRTVSWRSAALHLDRHLIADAAGVEIDSELPSVLHPLAVEREHHVARLQPGASGGAAQA